MLKCDFNKAALQLYQNRTSAWELTFSSGWLLLELKFLPFHTCLKILLDVSLHQSIDNDKFFFTMFSFFPCVISQG